MEKLLHYVWKHKLFPLRELATTDGRTVEVIDPGLYNRLDSGPDFFNAKMKVGGFTWVGNVEMHLKASDWFRHGHDKDEAYDGVVMHVVCKSDMDVTTMSGRVLPQMELKIPDKLMQDYAHLLNQDKYPPCYERIPEMPRLKLHAWLSALETERLERKTHAIKERLTATRGSWEETYFQTLARNFGFGVNGEAFEQWAQCIDLGQVAHYRDDIFQTEAYFIGQSGLLGRVEDKYAKEYTYLQHKYGLTPMDGKMWKYLRMRPQNFPHVRVFELAKMHYERRTDFGRLLDCKTVKDIGQLYGMKGSKLVLLIINTVIPMIFAYGREKNRDQYCDKAFDFLDELKAEDNHIVRMWQECGMEVKTAGDSQALIQLKNEYCDKKECLRCRIGFEYLSGKK